MSPVLQNDREPPGQTRAEDAGLWSRDKGAQGGGGQGGQVSGFKVLKTSRISGQNSNTFLYHQKQ